MKQTPYNGGSKNGYRNPKPGTLTPRSSTKRSPSMAAGFARNSERAKNAALGPKPRKRR